MAIEQNALDDAAPVFGPASVDAFLEAKLHWPSRRADWLRRPRLLETMQRVRDHPVTLVAAPVGYGKTTLVAQWLAEPHTPRTAWVSLDPGDIDPNRFWTHVAAALVRAGCLLPKRRPPPLSAEGATDSLISAILDAMLMVSDDIVLVLDDFHAVRDSTCHEQVELLISRLPPQAHLVVVTRVDPGLRLGRLRASGGLLEIRAAELGFTTAEVQVLLERRGIALDPSSVAQLVERIEGWPAGLYLATLSLADREDPEGFVREFSGGNRFIGDYLTEEVLSRHPADVREFIVNVSILDRFSAELCDHVTGGTGSAAILNDLERTNLFLVPLDEERRWYRFHPLFAAVARGELEFARPEQVKVLHARAAEWFDDHGNVDEAIRHGILAGRARESAELVQRHWLEFVDAGRIATVREWLHAIGPFTEPTDPAASVTAAWMAALIGDEATLADRLASMDSFLDHGPLPDGSRSVESAVAMIRGLFGYGGPVEMMRGAERAVALETDHHSPFFALSNVALGHAAYVAGDLDRAVAVLATARPHDRAPIIIQALGLATESLVEHERGNAARSLESAELAMALLEEHGLRAVPQASLAYTALGRAHAAAGRLADAFSTLERGLDLRRQTSAHGPWGMIHHLVVHAHVAAESGQQDRARELLGELDLRMNGYGDGMLAMHERVAAVRLLLDPEGPVLGEALTERETDILRLLRSSLSLQQIAGELYLSFNTVKTHTRAVYRKLGAHTRAEAVRIGGQQGLL
jgi:LuxR family transcriptional regulator, maltose regulon positive regulatory protein